MLVVAIDFETTLICGHEARSTEPWKRSAFSHSSTPPIRRRRNWPPRGAVAPLRSGKSALLTPRILRPHLPNALLATRLCLLKLFPSTMVTWLGLVKSLSPPRPAALLLPLPKPQRNGPNARRITRRSRSNSESRGNGRLWKLKAQFEAVRSRDSNAHVVPTHCGEASLPFMNPSLFCTSATLHYYFLIFVWFSFT